MKSTFDKAFGKYGGEADLDILPLSDEEKQDINQCLHQCSCAIATIRERESEMPRIVFGLTPHPEVGASVAKQDGVYCVALHYGSYYVMHRLFSRMLSSPNILPRVGDASNEKESKIADPCISNALALSRLDNSTVIPISLERRFLAKLMTFHAMRFLVMHELGHIANGHYDWGENASASKIDLQVLEYDSDCYAALHSLNDLSYYSMIMTILGTLEGFKDAQMLQDKMFVNGIWIFSILSLLRINVDNLQHYEDVSQSKYPTSGVRANIILSLYETFLGKRVINLDEKEHKQLIENAIEYGISVEQAFAEISLDNTGGKGRFNFVLGSDNGKYIDYLYLLWNDIRPKLEPYAKGKLAPLFNPDDKLRP